MDTTAPIKPSVQTKILLEKMEEKFGRDDDRWDTVMENLDLLFSRVGEIDKGQQRLEAQVGLSGQVMEQMLKDQQHLAKHMDITDQAVAQLTLLQKESPADPSPSPTISEEREPNMFQPGGSRQPCHQWRSDRNVP